jgi:hypothetical protein
MVFWLIGANTPIMKIYFKKIKKFEQKIHGIHSEHSMSIHQSFGVKRHFLWAV